MSETSTRALQGLRELTKLIPEYTGDLVSSAFEDYKGWISSTTNPILSYETYYDLSGYSLDDLTGMPIAAIIQDPGIYACGTNTRAQLHVLDILSQERLDRNDVYNLVLNNNVPGMALSENNFNQITFGNHRLMLAQGTFADPTGLSVFLPASQTQFGSGDAVATEKLWVYRFIVAPGITDITSIRVPASRFLLQMNIVKESDNVYLQRLRRSYEDAQ
tara:strand:- start:80 stop:733 length:654 start_codon:yes stop_codon:yes gene_type:complete